MAMLRVGKLIFRFKDGGIDYRWGDGEKRRIGFNRKKTDAENTDLYPDDYVENADTSDLNYDGRFSGGDDGYADEDYADDDYADNGYDDGYDDQDSRDFDDGGYDDRYDDQYDDEQYDDDRYADDDGRYDDGYDDEDYGEEPYDDGYEADDYNDRYYDEDADDGYVESYPEGNLGAILQYVDENDWVTYLLLVLLPPLGIYLLWRRRRFELPVRYGLSAASAVWFIALIVLIIVFGFGGRSDTTRNPGLTVPSVAPSPSTEVAVSPSPSVSPTPSVAPSPTPIGGAATASTTGVVYASATGNFYHNKENCELIASGETVTQVTLDNAKSRGKYACPYCYGGELYFATKNGKYYHLDYKCSGMSNPELYSEEQAKAEGKSACPVCVTKEKQSLYNTDNVVFITATTTDKSGVQVWWTNGGTYYHTTSNCSGMTGASKGSLRDALLYGKQACPTCCAAAGQLVWCTKGGKSYHSDPTCSGMESASQVTLAEALVLGKSRCYVCQPDTSQPSGQQTGAYYVYATPNGKYYHIDEHCSGMTDAVQVLLSQMVQIGRPACPVCCAGASMTVYASENGTYYHSYATCSGMTNAVQGTLAEALAKGYQRCPKCWGGNAAAGSDTVNTGDSSGTITADSIMVYATQSGQHYHTISNCSGMTNASYIPLRLAIQAGKTACSNCASAAQTLVYSTDGGSYFHKVSDCSGMQNAKRRTLADALMLNQQPCPVCYAAATPTQAPSTPVVTAPPQQSAEVDPSGAHYDEFTVGTSGVKVYALPTEEYYHTRSNCSGKSGLVQVALEVALNYGKSACPVCAASAESVVYATPNGRYYHISRSCAGDGAVAGTLAYALAYGFTPCPYCVTGSQTATVPTTGGTYTIGTSGVKVYAAVNGTYYHANKSHAESGAVQVTLETAMNYGKQPCPECCALASRTVYAVPNTTYYHSNKSCAGSNAVAGTFAQALAMGLQPCPNCIGSVGNVVGSTTPTAGAEYSAPASTVVYVDLYSDQFYYHKSSSCSGAGMSGGTPQTLEFAKDLGYYRCPYCNPPSGIN